MPKSDDSEQVAEHAGARVDPRRKKKRPSGSPGILFGMICPRYMLNELSMPATLTGEEVRARRASLLSNEDGAAAEALTLHFNILLSLYTLPSFLHITFSINLYCCCLCAAATSEYLIL